MDLYLGLFGKLPTAPDFVRLSATDSRFDSFDPWLVSSVESAHGRGGDEWRRAFAAGPGYAFVYRALGQPPEAPLLVGVLGPSADRAGRQFPLSVAAPFPISDQSLARPELLPIVLEPLWKQTSQVVAAAANLERASLYEHLGPTAIELCSLADAESTYTEWIGTLPVRELWALLYGEDFGEQPLLALRLLSEALRPYRGVERPNTPLTVWLPLGRAGGASVCAWLDLVKRLAGWRATIPSFFWSHDGNDGKLLLHLGQPPLCTVAELWLPSTSRDEVFDLSAQLSADRLQEVPPLAPSVASRCLTAPTIADLLNALPGV